jgi:(1->4)-alpha-D-glucan 1-alpha-D-glucosylmutase
MSSQLIIPVSTYRLQFNGDFRFIEARALVTYLNCLGISDVYASPVLKARQGSPHGYDVIDPTELNPELGSKKDFEDLVKGLRQHGMGLLLDIVPNHMATSRENPWWRDVQEKGPDSPFASFFDIGWLNFIGSKGKSTGHRRFFDIGDLIGVRVEEPKVFEATHSFVIRLVSEGKVMGLRIDHIDGLYDPLEYLRRLQRCISSSSESPRFYVVVEKILSGEEVLPEDWPVSGTTGYDFANVLNALLIDSDGLAILGKMYSQVTGSRKPFHDLVYEKKKHVMLKLFHGEINALGQWLAYFSGQFTKRKASQALREVTACLPVYRTYIRNSTVAASDRFYLGIAFREAENHGVASKDVLDFLKQVLLLDFPNNIGREKEKEWIDFVARWQQLTGAIMAKGYEDTALYNYHRLVSLNEVGGTPDTSGLSVDDFHVWNRNRLKNWPDTLNATSTHDTKRSEDARARISVLSEIPDEWQAHFTRWMQLNRAKKRAVKGKPMPEPNSELLLYQTLIGAWPIDIEEVPTFKERLKAYMLKAVREAKAITSWIKVNQEYEEAVLDFIDRILHDTTDNEFFIDFLKFQKKIAWYGALNSLSQLLLKITSPGVPDFYQGMELWDFSLVDPDNRRPVDFIKHKRLLDNMLRKEKDSKLPLVSEILASWKDGRIKLYVTYKALNCRREYSELFQRGDYIPLRVEGQNRENVCTFVRHYEDTWVLVAVPRLFTKLTSENMLHVGKQIWIDGRILLPEYSPKRWCNIFTDEIIAGENWMALAELFNKFPVAMLTPSA